MMKIFGSHDDATLKQLQMCVDAVPNSPAVLCADGHLGYSMPIGGVVAYARHMSPSGVGYDIGCGNMAVKTNIRYTDIPVKEWERIADEIFARISFGVGRKNNEPVDDPVFALIEESPVPQQRGLLDLARQQLGTVGSGNHYVDVLEDTDGYVWVACHFGSRGFGHKTATMYMNVAKGIDPLAKAHDGEMMSPPLLLDAGQPSGVDYFLAMTLAGEYAYAGRRHVVRKVLDILGNPSVLDTVHNHHNFTWLESHFDQTFYVVRKGATPAFPGQRGFIGSTCGDICVVVTGVETIQSREALYSTVHGAGRVLSRSAAIKGRHNWVCTSCSYVKPAHRSVMMCPSCKSGLQKQVVTPPVDFALWQDILCARGVILRGAGADEMPQCYRKLPDVLDAHAGTIRINVMMMPRIVCMAGKDVSDPYKD